MNNLNKNFEKINSIQNNMKNTKSYQMGYDAGMNGSNTTNSNFSIFSTPEKTKEWERGKKQAEIDKKKIKK